MKNGSSAIEDSLGAAIMETLLHSFVSDGRIDPKNLTDQQIRKEFVKQLKIFLSQKTLLGSVDHRSNILKKLAPLRRKKSLSMLVYFMLLGLNIGLIPPYQNSQQRNAGLRNN